MGGAGGRFGVLTGRPHTPSVTRHYGIYPPISRTPLVPGFPPCLTYGFVTYGAVGDPHVSRSSL